MVIIGLLRPDDRPRRRHTPSHQPLPHLPKRAFAGAGLPPGRWGSISVQLLVGLGWLTQVATDQGPTCGRLVLDVGIVEAGPAPQDKGNR